MFEIQGQLITRDIYQESEKFTRSKIDRDRYAQTKDAITVPILNSLEINDPKSFYALIMPCLYGVEAYILRQRGVPAKNMFALERNKTVHQEILKCERFDRQVLKGMRTTHREMSASTGLDRAYTISEKWNFIYLDFFSQPSGEEHYERTIRRIFSLKMLAKNSTLMLTFGRTRCSKEVSQVNKKMSKMSLKEVETLAISEMVQAAISETDHQVQKSIANHSYKSQAGHNKQLDYVTTVVKF